MIDVFNCDSYFGVIETSIGKCSLNIALSMVVTSNSIAENREE